MLNTVMTESRHKDTSFYVDRRGLTRVEMIKKYGILYLNEQGFYNYERHLTEDEKEFIGSDIWCGTYVDFQTIDYNRVRINLKEML